MTSRPWLRLYSEMIHDRKIRRLRPEHRWLWTALLCMAGASAERGRILVGNAAATVDDIADEAALHSKVVEAGLDELLNVGMLAHDERGWSVPAWDERQYTSDVSTERVKQHRQRKRNVSASPSESESDTDINSSVQELHVAEVPAVENEEVRSKAQAIMDKLIDARIVRAGASVRDPDAYRAKVRESVVKDIGGVGRLEHIIELHPTAPDDMLAGAALGEPTPYLKNFRLQETA